MNPPTLAPIYLDNKAVSLMGDPKPQVSKVVAATGKQPENCEVSLMQSKTDTAGRHVELDYVLDRTAEPTKAIYLTCVQKETDLQNTEGAASDTKGSISSTKSIAGGNPPFVAEARTINQSNQDKTQNLGSGPGKPGSGHSGKGKAATADQARDWPIDGKGT